VYGVWCVVWCVALAEAKVYIGALASIKAKISSIAGAWVCINSVLV
jgi:hypothetical protein